MFELTINDKAYQFNFGMGFMRELDPTITKPIEGVKGKAQNLGVQYAIAGIMDGDVFALADVLVRANKGFEPRLTQKEIESHIENEDTDLDALFEDVLGFLRRANVTKKVTMTLEETVAKERAKEAAKTAE